MELSKQEFEQEIKTAMKYLLEIEKHADDMDIDDIKYYSEQIMFPLKRMLNNLESGKLKQEKF